MTRIPEGIERLEELIERLERFHNELLDSDELSDELSELTRLYLEV